MKNLTKKKILIICVFSVLLLLTSISCGQEIDSVSDTVPSQSSFKTVDDSINGSFYNASTSGRPEGDEPIFPDPNPVVAPHYDLSHLIWVLIFILAIAISVIKKWREIKKTLVQYKSVLF